MIKKSCIFSFRARKKRSAEVLVSNVFFAFTEDIFLNYSKRIRPKAYETTEKEFLLIGLLFISFMNNSTIYIYIQFGGIVHQNKDEAKLRFFSSFMTH